ncbi:MAG: DUF805 domain-containing protein [Bdellovibrionales bacterium]|nr:DUF805 domain-containing protein [Bdellovibrionales bacterium]
MFDLFFSPSGRINRKVFIWSWFSLTFIELGITYFVEHPIGSFLVMLPGMYCMAVLSIKRFHDLDKSGWFYLTLWIPIVGLYFYALLVFKKGIAGNNTYGPDPLEKQKQVNTPVEPVANPAVNQYSIGPQKDIISISANSNPVHSASSPGLEKNLIVRVGIVLIIAAIIGYMTNSDVDNTEHLQQKLSKQTPESDRGLSGSTAENSELEENLLDNPPSSKFVFKVLSIDNDEVTVQFERNIPMNIKFFGVSKDLVRRAEILSRADQRQAVIFLNSASLLEIGKRYYGYLVNPSEEPTPPSEDWL